MTAVTLLLADGFSGMVLSCLLEPLRAARDVAGADVRWRIATVTGRAARSSAGLTIAPDPGEPIRKADLLILVAGYGVEDQMSPSTLATIRNAIFRHDTVIAADAAGWFLARLGLLDGAEAVVHWQDMPRFLEAYPAIRPASGAHARAGKLMTCGGASSALDLMLTWIGTRFGPAASIEVSRLFLHDPSRDRREGALPDRTSPALRRALNAMTDSIESPMPLARIAAIAATSLRTLDRLFATHLGTTPARHYTRLRLDRARDLAATTRLPMAEIAARTGYGSASALNTAYRARFGQPPGATRAQAQP